MGLHYGNEVIEYYHNFLKEIVDIANFEDPVAKTITFEDPMIRQMKLKSGLTLEEFYINLISEIRPKIDFNSHIIYYGSFNEACELEIRIKPQVLRYVLPHKKISFEGVHDILVNKYFRVRKKHIFSVNEGVKRKWKNILGESYIKSLNLKYKFLMKNIMEIKTKEELKIVCKILSLPSDESTFMTLSVKIINELQLFDDVSRTNVITGLEHLFNLAPETKRRWYKSVHDSVKDILMGNKGKLKVVIRSDYELLKFLSIFKELGIGIVPRKIIKEIEEDEELQDFFLEDTKKMIWKHSNIDNLLNILGSWITDPNGSKRKMQLLSESNSKFTPISFKMTKRSRRRSEEIIDKLIEIEDKKENIRDGRYVRNPNLSYLMKEKYDFKCQICKKAESKDVSIEVSHMIPLFFGKSFGGLDKSRNIEVLCHECHMSWEKQFNESILNNPDISTKEDLMDNLKKRFPENFQNIKSGELRSINDLKNSLLEYSFRKKRTQRNKKPKKLFRKTRRQIYREFLRLKRNQNRYIEFCSRQKSYDKIEAKSLANKYNLYVHKCLICLKYHVIESVKKVAKYNWTEDIGTYSISKDK